MHILICSLLLLLLFHLTVYGEHLPMLKKYISTSFKTIAMYTVGGGVYQNLLNQFPVTGSLWDFPPPSFAIVNGIHF